jgi:hypothetical protein
MKHNKDNPDVWNSIAYIGERQDFFRFAKSLISGLISLAEMQENTNLQEKLNKSKIYVLGTIKGIPIQRVILVWKDSETYKLLESQAQFAMTEEELDALLLSKQHKRVGEGP